MDLLRKIRASFLGLALLSAPAAAAELQATADYLVHLGGTNIASVSVRLSDTGSHYAMALDARIAGLAQFVASGTARIGSAGRSTGSGLVSEKFDLRTRAEGEDFTVAIEYASNDVTAFVIEPPLISPVDRVAVERKHLRDVNDMVASFVLKGGALDAGLCDRKLRIFTGIERFNVAMRYLRSEEATSKRTGYQGPVVLCSIGYSPVSGHSASSEITSYLAEDGQILIWYAPLQNPGYFIPYRVLVTTSVGDLSMVLTKLTQG
ncbi:MAG TPA: DUF3108 domain-containing protein [Devosiaceae bacterium]|nr:DUF3108 domain-containing protein [Devosiaceae bacterium]